MFRTVINYQRTLTVVKKLYNRNLPSIGYNSSFSDYTEKIGVKSEFKEDNPMRNNVKDAGKSIFDCENEKWCDPKKDDNAVTTYKKIYFDEHSPPEYIEIVIRKKWTKPDT